MLTLHQSNRLDRLAKQLSLLLSQPVGRPLDPETVVVQHPGMARWLSLETASLLGLSANLHFPLPAAFIWQIFHALLPDVPSLDRYQPNRLAWRIHSLLKKVEATDIYQPVTDYLNDGDEVKHFQLAQQLAALYDRYLVYRPEWTLAWEAGHAELPGDAWQADLWRRLVAEEPVHWVSLQQQFFNLDTIAELQELPARIFIFGVPTLSPGYLEIIHRLAEFMDVHLFLLNPCEAHWAEIVSPQTQARLERKSQGEQLYLEVGHPLLASLGRQGRDFFAAINELDPGSDTSFETAVGEGLLQRLQNQILQLEPPIPEPQWDHSIAFHACHSPMREVEVLYDQLLAMFEEMPDLSPSEILVMTPEIDRYAPLIEAVFSEPGDRPGIPFRVSDRSIQQTNPLATTFLEILQLPGSRYGVGAMLSLLENPAVRCRFALDSTALDVITEWIQMASIRWGRDGKSKSAHGLPPDANNTWQAGLRRLLLGYAMPGESDSLWHGTLPLDSVEGAAAEKLGGLLSFCNAVFGLESTLHESRSVSDWEVRLIALMEQFFLPGEESQGDAERLRTIIHQLATEAQEARFDDVVSLDLIQLRLQALLAAPDNRGFLGGGVSFCALAPMRSLPFRVICLLGMNDGAFPRQQPVLDFDLMNRQFRFGDRSRRVDDRYLFLETLISARDRFYVSYVGRSQRDNSSMPPSVVVDELRDTLLLMVGEKGLETITCQHPLQPFSPDYFSPESKLFSFSQQRREAAMLVGQGPNKLVPLLGVPLPLKETDAEVSLQALIQFFTNPPRSFVRERLLLALETAESLPDEREPFALERFERLDLERGLVESLLQGETADTRFANFQAAGTLPHGQAGRADFQHMLSHALSIADRVKQLQLGDVPSMLDLDYQFDGVRLTGRLMGVTHRGLLAYSTETLYPYQLLNHWIRHLTLNLIAPKAVELQTQLLEGNRAGHFRPVEYPQHYLEMLIGHYQEGYNRPLRFYPATSWAYVEGLKSGGEEKAMDRAQAKWYGNRGMTGDAQKPYNRLLWPDGSFFTQSFESNAVEILQPLMDHLEWT
ncbi:MAG: exodeoxyribonuclease V subunit gamma [Candidatus Thiodiazotropha sp. (ex Myrtea sp. 'scaly one' KF741663)]|nr:exodeoxyribonuclease V subunit gamma [Candidatus Thiodiazotropha sp. (ex Myrtea sp. 'scaly one' KF741663)]